MERALARQTLKAEAISCLDVVGAIKQAHGQAASSIGVSNHPIWGHTLTTISTTMMIPMSPATAAITGLNSGAVRFVGCIGEVYELC